MNTDAVISGIPLSLYTVFHWLASRQRILIHKHTIIIEIKDEPLFPAQEKQHQRNINNSHLTLTLLSPNNCLLAQLVRRYTNVWLKMKTYNVFFIFYPK